MAARVGFEPATFRTQGTELTTQPPRPTNISKIKFYDKFHQQSTEYTVIKLT